MIADHLERARIALDGLSVGDAAGGFFEFSDRAARRAAETRTLPAGTWRYTDDTSMALSIYANLRQHGEINQDALALSLAAHYDRTRGYGRGAHYLLSKIQQGAYWRDAAASLFSGEGSFGNGGAMRVAPVGAYFADDIPAAVESAWRSAEITHTHPEGIAGAVAVAVATALACQGEHDLLEKTLPHVPPGEVRDGLQKALAIRTTREAAERLGSGQRVSAQDTVPFALWVAAHYQDDYIEAFWQAVSAGGDVDTTCAMVGGIVASYGSTTPAGWLAQREPLPRWAFEDGEGQ